MLEQSYEIARVNWKHNLLVHCCLALVFCLLAPMIMGLKNLEELQVAKIIEMYLSFLGVILLIPLFIPDGNRDIRDLIASKRFSITGVRLIRLIQSVIILMLVLLAFLYTLKQGNCTFHYGRCFYVAVANCVAMGGLGLLFYSVTDQIVLAYMMPFAYYIISLGAGRKYLKEFWLFSFSAGRIEDKKYILFAGTVLIIVALFIKWKRRT